MVPFARCPRGNPRPKSKLCRRERQTLAGLLRGDSEKQVAAALGLSPHTIHIYIKSLYAFFNVSSRGELTSTVLKTMVERITRGLLSADDLRDHWYEVTAQQVTVERADFWLRIVNVNFPDSPIPNRTARTQRPRARRRIPGFDAR